MRNWVVLLAVVGCDSGPKEAPVSKPEERRTPPSIADAISVAPPLPPPLPPDAAIVPVAHALTTGWLDAPPWPATGGDTLEITWLVGTDLIPRASDHELLESPLSVVIAIGGVSRQAYLKQQFGSLKGFNQRVCSDDQPPGPKGSLAQITFAEGGQGGYYVRRKASDVIEILSWEQEDGACTVHGQPAECPRREVAAVRMHVPRTKVVHEAIFYVDAAGNRTPFDCKS